LSDKSHGNQGKNNPHACTHTGRARQAHTHTRWVNARASRSEHTTSTRNQRLQKKQIRRIHEGFPEKENTHARRARHCAKMADYAEAAQAGRTGRIVERIARWHSCVCSDNIPKRKSFNF